MLRFSNRLFLVTVLSFLSSRAQPSGSAVRHSCAPLLPVHNLHPSSPNLMHETPLCLSAFPGEVRGTADPSAALGMTKRGGSLQGQGDCWMKQRLLNRRIFQIECGQLFQPSPIDKLRSGSAGLFKGACVLTTQSWANLSKVQSS